MIEEELWERGQYILNVSLSNKATKRGRVNIRKRKPDVSPQTSEDEFEQARRELEEDRRTR